MIMKFNKLTMAMGSVLMVASAASFAFAAPYQETTSTKKTRKAKKTTDTTTATTATTATKAPAAAPTKMAKTTKSETTKNATDAQIAAAKSGGQVWVNTSTKVYHDSSSQFYGSTKAGKFMSEKDATAAGYHKSKSGN